MPNYTFTHNGQIITIVADNLEMAQAMAPRGSRYEGPETPHSPPPRIGPPATQNNVHCREALQLANLVDRLSQLEDVLQIDDTEAVNDLRGVGIDVKKVLPSHVPLLAARLDEFAASVGMYSNTGKFSATKARRLVEELNSFKPDLQLQMLASEIRCLLR